MFEVMYTVILASEKENIRIYSTINPGPCTRSFQRQHLEDKGLAPADSRKKI